MQPKSYRVFKWVIYALATLFLCGLQETFFAILFPVIASLSGGIAGRLLSRGFLCALIVSSLGMLASGAFRMLAQILSGGQYLGLMARISLGETLLTLPALLLVLPLYRTIFRRCTADY